MAGGESTRMRATFGHTHKALIPVLGVTMLERNLCKLLSAGFHNIVVAVSEHEPEIIREVETRGRALAEATGATIECFKEKQQLGTIGVAREFKDRFDPLLVVNVDNLTALDLRALVAYHQKSEAALTVATHFEPLQIPYGEVIITDGRITRYLEKPIKQTCVSSGTYVLGPRALDLIKSGHKTNVPELIDTLLEGGESVGAFQHNAPWIDVNDSITVEKAERLISEQYREFEYWDQTPDYELSTLLLHSSREVLVERRAETALRYPGLWDIPGEQLRDSDHGPSDAIARQIKQQPDLSPTFLTSFDDLDTSTGKILRHHVFFVHVDDKLLDIHHEGEVKWISLDAASSDQLSHAAVRSLASFRRRL
ncbi:MAG TPA: sugar phosphate nucleotidyltransferase [Pyrinomonadaceae bacterium]|nr:sugar phosphate nucleotidyltransferase [Pyrinomonadaceae bacterium]